MNREHVAKVERDNISNTFWWGCSCGQGDSAWIYEARARAAMEQHLASVAAPPAETPITNSRTGWWDPHTGRSGEPTEVTIQPLRGDGIVNREHVAQVWAEIDGTWTTRCSCGWVVPGWRSESDARDDRDEHLAEVGALSGSDDAELDPELLAMSTIVPLMDALDPDARRRVIQWIADRW